MSGMKDSTTREQILANIRNALLKTTEVPFDGIDISSDVFKSIDEADGLEITFAKELISSGGEFIYCESEKQFLEYFIALFRKKEWPAPWCNSPKMQQFLSSLGLDFEEHDSDKVKPLIGVTDCERLIAQTGSVLISDSKCGSRSAYAMLNIHLVVAYTSQIVSNLKQAFTCLRQDYPENLPSQFVVISGPSKTDEIEKEFVKGAQGASELIVFLIEK